MDIANGYDITSNLFAAKSSPFIVSVVSRNLPVEMTWFRVERRTFMSRNPGEHVFWNSGTVIECEEDAATRKFISTIIVAATIFVRTNGLQPQDIKVDVHLFDGRVCQGKVFACDFHYNLAAVRIQTDAPLQTPILKHLDDIVSIDLAELPHLCRNRSFQLLPHSNLFKIFPGMKIITVERSVSSDFIELSIRSDFTLHVTSGVLSTNLFDPELDCNELYYVKGREDNKGEAGGTVINCYGEVIGILFYSSSFLPINIVLRWWSHFKSCGQYRRPWLGVEIANLHSSRVEFLEQFVIKFPNISAGVIVTKVAEASPAACSGILAEDVIVACDGKPVHSKLKFFELLWDKVGESVVLNVARPSNGNELKVNIIVGESTQDTFYHWPLIHWMVLGQHTKNI